MNDHSLIHLTGISKRYTLVLAQTNGDLLFQILLVKFHILIPDWSFPTVTRLDLC